MSILLLLPLRRRIAWDEAAVVVDDLGMCVRERREEEEKVRVDKDWREYFNTAPR